MPVLIDGSDKAPPVYFGWVKSMIVIIVEENNDLLGNSQTSREFLVPACDEETLQRSDLATAADGSGWVLAEVLMVSVLVIPSPGTWK